jgi:hypothetical protein
MDRPCSVCAFPDPVHRLPDIQGKAISLNGFSGRKIVFRGSWDFIGSGPIVRRDYSGDFSESIRYRDLK